MTIITPGARLAVPTHLATPLEVRVASLERQLTRNKESVNKTIQEFKKVINDMQLLINSLTFEQQSRQRQDIPKT